MRRATDSRVIVEGYMRCLSVALLVIAGAGPAAGASLDRSIEVALPAAELWRRIGPFCSIRTWQPLAGSCTEAGDTRTVKTKDGKITFVEKQTARDDKAMTYSYQVEQGPLPITKYVATLEVRPEGENKSTVEWSSRYTPIPGKEAEAKAGILAIYKAGLDNIHAMSR